MKKMKKFKIYTDGSCYPNPGTGGWGALIVDENRSNSQIWGGEFRTTNNRMEMLAAINALKSIGAAMGACMAEITTDSQYLRKGITQWIRGWSRNGWRTSTGDDVKNKDLWIELSRLTDYHHVTWKWVKGHNGHHENEIADKLAERGRKECRNR